MLVNHYGSKKFPALHNFFQMGDPAAILRIRMTFQEKLRRLAPTINKSKEARAVGLKENAISTYVAKNSRPRIDIALKIARALNVPLEWLADDEQDWPPPAMDKPTVREFSDAELIHDIARRYRSAQIDFLSAAAKAKVIDWQKAADAAEGLKPGDKMPDFVRQAMLTLHSVQAKFNHISGDLDVERYCVVNHEQLPGGDKPIGEFEMVSRGDRWWEITVLPGIDRFGKIIGNHPDWLKSPLKKLDDEYEIKSINYAQAMARHSREDREVKNLKAHPTLPPIELRGKDQAINLNVSGRDKAMNSQEKPAKKRH